MLDRHTLGFWSLVSLLPMAHSLLSHSIRINWLAIKQHFRLFSRLFPLFQDPGDMEPVKSFEVFRETPFLQARFVLRFAIIQVSLLFSGLWKPVPENVTNLAKNWCSFARMSITPSEPSNRLSSFKYSCSIVALSNSHCASGIRGLRWLFMVIRFAFLRDNLAQEDLWCQELALGKGARLHF